MCPALLLQARAPRMRAVRMTDDTMTRQKDSRNHCAPQTSIRSNTCRREEKVNQVSFSDGDIALASGRNGVVLGTWMGALASLDRLTPTSAPARKGTRL